MKKNEKAKEKNKELNGFLLFFTLRETGSGKERDIIFLNVRERRKRTKSGKI